MLTDVGRGATAETLTVQEQEDAFFDPPDGFPMPLYEDQPEIKVEEGLKPPL